MRAWENKDAVYELFSDYSMDSVFQLIIRRFLRQFGRTLLFWVIVPIAVIIVFNLLMLSAAYVECRTFGSVTWAIAPR